MEPAVETPGSGVNLREILDPQRVVLGLPCLSKKRLLEQVAGLLKPAADTEADILQLLNERERLGSTGIGQGVALPHARVVGLKNTLAAFATVDAPIDFDANDDIPVSLVFAVLVPEDATREHLQLLAHLARMFSNADLREQLTVCQDPEMAYRILTEWQRPEAAE